VYLIHVQQIRGNVLKARVAFIEEHGGATGVDRVLERLRPEDRASLRMITTVRWYPFELGKRLDEAIVSVLGDGRSEFFERLGESSAQRNLTQLHGGYLTPGDPHAFLAKCQVIYGHYYETGRREYVRTGPSSGTLTTHDAEAFSIADCLTVVGWYRRALELCGGKDVKISEKQCRGRGDPVCQYEIGWQP
jgi:uncharacterized protein (TIGR02265 family)